MEIRTDSSLIVQNWKCLREGFRSERRIYLLFFLRWLSFRNRKMRKPFLVDFMGWIKVLFTLMGEIISCLYMAGECNSPLQYWGLSSDKLILVHPHILSPELFPSGVEGESKGILDQPHPTSCDMIY